MKTLKLTVKDFKEVDGYKEYTGKEDLTDFDGNLEVAAGLGWIRFSRIKVSGYIWIEAGSSIKAGDSIKAGSSIEAGGWIEAGDWIEAERGGILVGLSITCKGLLKFKLRLFAGVSPYSWNENCSKEVRCGKLDGNVVYGDVIETGLPDEQEASKQSDNPKEITIDGATYRLVE